MTTTRLTRSERSALTRRELLAAADEAGYTKGAVYSTFRSKAGLYLALFDEVPERRLGEIRELLAAHDDAGDRIAALARQPVEETNSQFCCWRSSSGSTPRASRRRWRSTPSATCACESLAALAPAGGALDPARWAIVTLALSNGPALERLIDPAGVPGDLMGVVQRSC